MLSVGLVGLPNVGKSTLFNAVTVGAAKVSNYPFTTIDRNVGVVPVPDPRLDELARILEPAEVTPCFLEMIDIAGLVEGASRGEGLGNRFLEHIRQVDAVVHVLRAFEEADVAHVLATVDPVRDAEVVETELLLADLEVLGRTAERRRRVWNTEPAAHREESELVERALEALAAGQPLRSLGLTGDERRRLEGFGMLSGKPLVYVANLGEAEIGSGEPPEVQRLRRRLAPPDGPEADVIGISAKLEEELIRLEPGERREFMAELGLEASGLERLVERCFERLDLVRFYTVVGGKLRAWEIERGTTAPAAAGEVHSDMERGFIRAEVVDYEALARAGNRQALQKAGKVRVEGRDYEIRDGDVVEFLFHV